MNRIYLLIFIISLFLLLKNIFELAFSMENYRLHKKRLKQLQFEKNKTNDEELNELIDKVTQPVVKTIIPKLKLKNLNEIEKDLKMAQWDKKMTSIQYVALNIITKILGILAFLLLFKHSKPMAFLWGIVLFFGISFLMKNSAKNRKEKLMMEFPDFIRITQGYLSAGMPFTKAVTECIQYVGEEWQPILENFVVKAELDNIDIALKEMAEEVNIFEVKEFVSLVRLALEQGGNVKDGFEAQAEKIQQMLYDVMMAKIERRRVFGILIQAPLLLCNLMVFGLPTIDAMMNMSAI